MQAMTEASADPPTMKNAGRLGPYSDGYGPDGLSLTIMALVFGLLATGAMLQAVMTNHGRRITGLGLNALAGAVTLTIFTGIVAASGPPFPWGALFGMGAALGLFWAVLATLAFAVGSLVQPGGGARHRS